MTLLKKDSNMSYKSLHEQLKNERDKLNALEFADNIIIKDLREQLRRERKLRKELVERAFVAGRGKGSWAQFQKDNRYLIKSIING